MVTRQCEVRDKSVGNTGEENQRTITLFVNVQIRSLRLIIRHINYSRP